MQDFGRDYITSGEYIEKKFLNKNVRYIAVLDKVDNFEDRVYNDFVPIKGVFNEIFCKETSKSVKKSKRKKMQEGFYACTTPPYGYIKDPEKPGKLIIDKKVAKNVKKIFELKIKGLTQKEIAEYLNKGKIQTPAQYLNLKGMSSEIAQIWTRSSVSKILCNRVYVGDCVRGKTQNISYKTKKRINIKKKDLIIVENTHEPIITREMYNKVHEGNKIFGTTKENVNKIDTKFGNYIYCHNCGKKMQKRNVRGRINLHCSSNRKSNELCHFSDNYYYEEIEPLITYNIKEIFKNYFKDDFVKMQILKKYNLLKIDELISKSTKYDMMVRKLTFEISQLYNDRLNDLISEEEYKKQYYQLLEKRKSANIEKEKVELEMIKFKNGNSNIEEIKNIIEEKDFSKEDIEELIDKIEIGNRCIYIYFKFDERKNSCNN